MATIALLMLLEVMLILIFLEDRIKYKQTSKEINTMTKYFDFNGTATRSEYWGVLLLTSLSFFMIFSAYVATESGAIALLFVLSAVPMFWVNLATYVRRLRDSGYSLFWIIAFFLPLVSYLTIVVFGCLPTSEKEIK